ncbi:protein YgfX [Gynuella sp.]|uniref:protein YgfX n=1 Tax=Gynuella sp. TaxID=2969146 RepID=UPI003D10093B
MSTISPIELKITPSRWMKRWIYLLLIVCLMVVAQLSQRWTGYLVLMFPLGWYIGRLYLRWVVLNDEASIVRIILEGHDLRCMTSGGNSFGGRLVGQQWLSRWLIVLRYRDERGKSYHLPIFQDAAGTREFHRLLVALKITPTSG